jgi:hypothetical protein
MDKQKEIQRLKVTGLFTALFIWSCIFIGIPSAVICLAILPPAVAMGITATTVLGTSIYFTAQPAKLAKLMAR